MVNEEKYVTYQLVSDVDSILFESFDRDGFFEYLRDWLFENDAYLSSGVIKMMSETLLYLYIKEIHQTQIFKQTVYKEGL